MLIKKKQLSVTSVFADNGSGALDLAAGGVTDAKLASGIDGSKISASTMPGTALTNASIPGTKFIANSIAADKLEQAVLNMINRGTSMREAVLTTEQLIGGASGGVAPATVIVFNANPTANDTLALKNGTVTETYTFKAVESAAFEVEIGVDAAATAQKLVDAITADSANGAGGGWGATLEIGLDDIAATAVVIYRKVAIASGSEEDRVYKTNGTALRTINFASGRYDATVSAAGAVAAIDADNLVTLDGSDPVTPNFGYGRALAGLIDGDLRFVMADNVGYAFDADSNTWNLGLGSSVAAGSVGPTELNASVAGNGLAGGGGDALSVNVDNTGIEINADTLRLKDLGVTTAKLAATSVTAAKLGNDVAGNGLGGGNGSALTVAAANASINVSGAGVKAAIPSDDDLGKNTAGAITGGNDQDSGLTVAGTPAAVACEFAVYVNGIKVQVGNGVKTGCDCYFTADAGATARAFGAIASGDALYWNCTIAGYDLAAADEIDFVYPTTA